MMRTTPTRRTARLEEPASRERWLVSYGDLLTLLFAVFVALYAASKAGEASTHARLDAVTAAFDAVKAAASATPSSVVSAPPQRELAAPDLPNPIATTNDPARDAPRVSAEIVAPEMLPVDAPPVIVTPVPNELDRAFATLGARDDVHLAQSARGIAVEIDASVLFSPADATLDPKSKDVLDALGTMLSKLDNAVEVQGHTDGVPIASAIYPSNWELAGARASAVVRALIASGVAAQRLSAVSYADNRPSDNGDTPAARAHNRRVTVMVYSDDPSAHVR